MYNWDKMFSTASNAYDDEKNKKEKEKNKTTEL